MKFPEKVDLVVVTTKAEIAPEVIRQRVQRGIASAIVTSAGFGEVGPEGKKPEDELSSSGQGQIRLIGPNFLGLMNPRIGLNATFAQTIAQPGRVAFISQSGALETSR